MGGTGPTRNLLNEVYDDHVPCSGPEGEDAGSLIRSLKVSPGNPRSTRVQLIGSTIDSLSEHKTRTRNSRSSHVIQPELERRQLHQILQAISQGTEASGRRCALRF